MSTRQRSPARWRVVTLLAVAVSSHALSSCAPPPGPAPLETGTLRARYLAALDQRERAARSIEAQLELWAALGGRTLPGALATLDLAAPDRCRLRVAEPGGTALDAVGSGANLWAWLPGSRSLDDLTACADSAALADLPSLVVRGAAALWRPGDPDSAADSPDDAARGVLQWREGDRTYRMSLAADATPDTVIIARDSSAVRIVYREWMQAGSARLPREMFVTAGHGTQLRCRVARLRLGTAPDSSQFTPPGPSGLTPQADCELWHLFASGAEP